MPAPFYDVEAGFWVVDFDSVAFVVTRLPERVKKVTLYYFFAILTVFKGICVGLHLT